MDEARTEANGRSSAVPTFEELVGRHAETLYRVAFRLTGRADVAEDLVQESFLDAFRGLKQLRSGDSAFAWLVCILRRRRVKWLKANAKSVVLPFPMVDLAAPVPPPPPIVDAEELERALDRLPEEYREPVILFYFENLKYREIAEALETPIGTVMSRLARAKALLRSMLVDATSDGKLPNEVRDGSP
jgi:RNA polymerase sigma-70 factor, ECF subfamily